MELDRVLKLDSGVELKAVIEVEVCEAVARERVLGRARGADDNEEVFANRLRVYTEPLGDIRSFYSNLGLLHTINGERSIEEIVGDMHGFISSKL